MRMAGSSFLLAAMGLTALCFTATGWSGGGGGLPLNRRNALLRGAGGIIAVGVGSATAWPRLAFAKGSISKSGYDLTPLSPEEVAKATEGLTDLQKKVLLQAGTERAFSGKTVNGYSHDTKAKGTWVSAVSGVPLFSSTAKYDSGTGWPSFYAPVDPAHIIERVDPKDKSSGLPSFLWRTEVLDRKSGTHLGVGNKKQLRHYIFENHARSLAGCHFRSDLINPLLLLLLACLSSARF
jgi:peptide methionine sulfoxide reductase MsrB